MPGVSFQGRCLVGDRGRDGNRLAAIDEGSRGGKRCGSGSRGPDQDLSAAGGGDHQVGVCERCQSGGRGLVMWVVDGERGDRHAGVKDDQLRHPARSWSRYPAG